MDIRLWTPRSRKRENGISVKWGMNRPQRTGQAILSHDRQTPASDLIETGIRRDDRQGRMGASDRGAFSSDVVKVR